MKNINKNHFNDWFGQNYKGNEGKTLSYEDPYGAKRDILMKLAEPVQTPMEDINTPDQGVPEGMSFFNKEKATDFVNKAQDVAAGRMDPQELKGGQVYGINNDKINEQDNTPTPEFGEDPVKKINKKQPDWSKMGKDLGKALAGPTDVIDMGKYSTFTADDAMADLKKQVLMNISNR